MNLPLYLLPAIEINLPIALECKHDIKSCDIVIDQDKTESHVIVKNLWQKLKNDITCIFQF